MQTFCGIFSKSETKDALISYTETMPMRQGRVPNTQKQVRDTHAHCYHW